MDRHPTRDRIHQVSIPLEIFEVLDRARTLVLDDIVGLNVKVAQYQNHKYLHAKWTGRHESAVKLLDDIDKILKGRP